MNTAKDTAEMVCRNKIHSFFHLHIHPFNKHIVGTCNVPSPF